jgi:hypothetical protein
MMTIATDLALEGARVVRDRLASSRMEEVDLKELEAVARLALNEYAFAKSVWADHLVRLNTGFPTGAAHRILPRTIEFFGVILDILKRIEGLIRGARAPDRQAGVAEEGGPPQSSFAAFGPKRKRPLRT